MKDEEIAEEIANKRCHEIMCYGHCSFNSPKHHRCGGWHREYNCALAGLKAGRPQWHDLRKDPNDLPDTDRIVYVQTKSDTGNAYHDNDGWHSTQVSGIVIAWCEIPTFDKE